MSDVVDKLLEQSMSAQGGSTAAQDQKGNESSQGGLSDDKRSRAMERIQGLISQNKDLQSRMERLEQENQSLRSSTSRTESEKPLGAARSWDEFSDSQLHQIATASPEDPNLGRMRDQAREEILRRFAKGQAEDAAKTYYERAKQELRQEQYRNQVFSRIHNRFGDQINDRSSELYRGANEEYAELQSVHGNDADRYPEFQELAFWRAHDRLAEAERQELERLREFRKRVEAAEGSRVAAAPVPEERKQLLEQGNVSGAINDVANRLFPEFNPNR